MDLSSVSEKTGGMRIDSNTCMWFNRTSGSYISASVYIFFVIDIIINSIKHNYYNNFIANVYVWMLH